MYREVTIVFILLTVTVSLTIYGAIGPSVTLNEEFGWNECDTPSTTSIGRPFITEERCTIEGRHYDPDSTEAPPTRDRHMYYVTIPVKRMHRVLNRWHQFLLVDFNIAFKQNYLKELQKSGQEVFAYEVALGYRNGHSKEWSYLTAGNSSRIFDCHPNYAGIYSCELFPLFELWSVYHEHYIVNLRFSWLPILGEHRDNSVIREMSLHIIHQHPLFTWRWFMLKTIFFLFSLLSFTYSINKRNTSLYHKGLLFLNASLLLFNIPLEWLSLYIDTPWMTLFNDLRQGLLILMLMIFWTVLIRGHDVIEGGSMRSLCIPFLLASITAAGFLVYEISERGIQVWFPFYSLWGSTFGRGLVYTAVGVASGCGLLYLLSLVISFVQVRRKIVTKLSEGAPGNNKSQLLKTLYSHLLITILVALCSILGYILPAELFLLQSFHGYTKLSLYGALLMSNYGLWNSYIMSLTLLSSSSPLSGRGYKVLSASIN